MAYHPKSMSGVLKAASEFPLKKDKIEFLRKNCTPVYLQFFTQYVFNKDIIWALPKGAPPYKENEFDDQEGRFLQEVKRLYLYVEGGNPNLTSFKREQLFVGLLESIDKEDAKMLIFVKDNRRLPFPGITENLISETFGVEF